MLFIAEYTNNKVILKALGIRYRTVIIILNNFKSKLGFISNPIIKTFYLKDLSGPEARPGLARPGLASQDLKILIVYIYFFCNIYNFMGESYFTSIGSIIR